MLHLGRVLMTVGATLLVVGILVRFFGARLGHLPGDLRIGDSVYVPIGTCLVVSLLLTVLLNVFGRIFWR
jgi:hypothetical protein